MTTLISLNFRRTLLLSFILSTLYSVLYALSPTTVSASTDPQLATVSATATVPVSSTNPSDSTAPYPIILIAPIDGAVTNQSRPEFSWRQTSDPNSNFLLYTLKLNGVSTFLGISNSGNTQQHNFVSHIGDGNVYLTPTFDMLEGSYDWSVVATDPSSNQTSSASWHFTIDQTSPILQVIDIAETYRNPSILEGSNFDLPGPQTVKLIVATEPWATVSLKLTNLSGIVQYTLSYPSNASGLVYPQFYLDPGVYNLSLSSFDHAGLTTTLPNFTLTLTRPTLNLTVPGIPGLTQPTTIPYTLPTITSLPATISQINASLNITVITYILLAISSLVLLIYILYRRYNILIIDSRTNLPIRSIKIYHSKPTTKRHGVYVTSRSPLLYELSATNHGRTFIKDLGYSSSLTLTTPDNRTLILSISRSQSSYTFVI